MLCNAPALENRGQHGNGGEEAKNKQKQTGSKGYLRIASWNKGGANQELRKKKNEIELQLYSRNIHCLGITEANLREGQDLEEVTIPGYTLLWDSGRENITKANSRVVAYIQEDLSFEVVKSKMGGDMMPELWIRLGHKGTRRTLVGFVYREHSPWGVQEGSVREQELRWERWLEARRDTWKGKDEVFVLGDMNLDWKQKEDPRYRNRKMIQKLSTELVGQGWVQLVKEVTHFTNRAGLTSESLIDHVWTNSPSKVINSGQEELAASDHHLVWVDRVAKKLVERVKKTEKRSMKNFKQEDLEELCRQQNWKYTGPNERTEEVLENRVTELEEKMIKIIEMVAPMKVKKMKNKGKPRWMTQELTEKVKDRVKWRKVANRTKREEDETVARKKRNETGKAIKKARQEHLRKRLENLDRNSTDSWAAVGEFLGWRKPMTPTMLVQNGKVINKGQELAETMLEQYRTKEIEVEAALGQVQGDYLAPGRMMTQGNKAVFSFKKVTKKEVEAQIQKVDNKESFGHDKLSYSFIKKMKPWIAEEMTQIMNLSLEVGKYPRRWKVARVKPMYKGGGCDRQAPKSYRPVALLSATSRIMEALLARQLDNYQEEHGLVHKGVHGFRRGRGTNTAMLEVWEYVLSKTEKGELVALDFLDISAGFDTMVHLYLLRKLEVQFGVAEKSLAWLNSYLEGWLQYTVVEASSSTPRQITKGAPQGGGLSPVLWRSNTNDIPEAGLKKRDQPIKNNLQEGVRDLQRKDQGLLSKLIDEKERPSLEEQLDRKLRSEGVWNLTSWREERSGGMEGVADRLITKEKDEAEDVITTIYADDTQSRASAKSKKELEKRNSSGLTKVCEELKKLRLKVNEDKTTYMILATQGRRARENLESEITVCGERVKSVKVGKALGLLVSCDLTWKDQVDKTVKSCQEKMGGLWKCTSYLKQYQRKLKAEGIVMSRLRYCLEVVSSGRKIELERLQGVQSAAARWVLQTRKRDWSLSGGLKKLGWLSMAQLAVYSSLKLAVRVLREHKPERLYEILTEEAGGDRVRRRITDNSLKKMKATTRKAWSVRVLRWLELIPEHIKQEDMTKRTGREELKRWIKHTIPVRGDRVLWGRPLTGDQRRRRGRTDQQPQDPEEGASGEDQRPGDNTDPHNSQEEEEQGQTFRREAGTGVKRVQGGAGADSQTVVDTISLYKCCETQTVGVKLMVKMKDNQVGQVHGVSWRRSRHIQYRWKKKLGSTGGKSLPCSRAAVVKTSPPWSRKTGTSRDRAPGELGEMETVTAETLLQAWFQEGRTLPTRGKGRLERSMIGEGACSWTRGFLIWRKGIG